MRTEKPQRQDPKMQNSLYQLLSVFLPLCPL
jgi:hypothetical protein